MSLGYSTANRIYGFAPNPYSFLSPIPTNKFSATMESTKTTIMLRSEKGWKLWYRYILETVELHVRQIARIGEARQGRGEIAFPAQSPVQAVAVSKPTLGLKSSPVYIYLGTVRWGT